MLEKGNRAKCGPTAGFWRDHRARCLEVERGLEAALHVKLSSVSGARGAPFEMAISIFDACALFGPWPQHDDLTLPNLFTAMSQNNITRALVMSTTGIYSDYRAGN